MPRPIGPGPERAVRSAGVDPAEPTGRRRSRAGTFRSVAKERRLCADPWRRGGFLDTGARARIGIAGPVMEVVAVIPARITIQMSLADWHRALGDGPLVCVKASDA